MNVHFIDTTVFTNIVDVPFMNDERVKVMAELKELVTNRKENQLLLPFATIIETGNHIAHNGDGNQRREAAERFKEILEKTISDEAPWHYYGKQMTAEDLKCICKEFPDFAMRGEGFGDLSIIQAYTRYKEETPAIHRIRIWSLDEHLKSVYDEVLPGFATRN